MGSRDAKRKRYCCVLIVNNQPALLIALADYAISDKLAVRGGIGGTLCAESVQNDRHTKMLCLEACNNDRWGEWELDSFLVSRKKVTENLSRKTKSVLHISKMCT